MHTLEKPVDYLIKVIIIGDAGVGKTCLLLRFCEGNFISSHLPTIGLDFKLKTVLIDNKKVKLQIWDSAGQERFKTITQTYFRSSQGVILSYAVNDRDSFNNVEEWIDQVKKHAGEDISMVLVGNKIDMPGRCVEYEEGEKLAKLHNIQFFETSTKEGDNVQSAFQAVLRNIISRIKLNKAKLEAKGKRKTRAKLPALPVKATYMENNDCCF